MVAYDGRYDECFSWKEGEEQQQQQAFNMACVQELYRNSYFQNAGMIKFWQVGIEICAIIILGETVFFPEFDDVSFDISFRQMLNAMLNDSGYSDRWIANPNHTKSEYAEMARTVMIDNGIEKCM